MSKSLDLPFLHDCLHLTRQHTNIYLKWWLWWNPEITRASDISRYLVKTFIILKCKRILVGMKQLLNTCLANEILIINLIRIWFIITLTWESRIRCYSHSYRILHTCFRIQLNGVDNDTIDTHTVQHSSQGVKNVCNYLKLLELDCLIEKTVSMLNRVEKSTNDNWKIINPFGEKKLQFIHLCNCFQSITPLYRFCFFLNICIRW